MLLHFSIRFHNSDVIMMASINHPQLDYLLNHLFRRRSKKISKLRVTDLRAGNRPVISPQKGPVAGKLFPFDYAILFHWHLGNRMVAAMLMKGFLKNMGK